MTLNMVRKQIFITADQNRQLKLRAAELGVAEAEIVRRGIELAITGIGNSERDWREALTDFTADGQEFEELAERIAASKRVQAERWDSRMREARRKSGGV